MPSCLSVERHILRNFIFLHAIENDLPLPIGTTDAGLLDPHSFDEDAEKAAGDFFDTDDDEENEDSAGTTALRTEEDFASGLPKSMRSMPGNTKGAFAG